MGLIRCFLLFQICFHFYLCVYACVRAEGWRGQRTLPELCPRVTSAGLTATESISGNQRMRSCTCLLDPCLSPHKFSILYVPAKEEFVGNGQKFFIGRWWLIRGVGFLLVSTVPAIWIPSWKLPVLMLMNPCKLLHVLTSVNRDCVSVSWLPSPK